MSSHGYGMFILGHSIANGTSCRTLHLYEVLDCDCVMGASDSRLQYST